MPSNPRSRPVINIGQNRMAPAPPGNGPLLPPHPKAPRTLPIDDFIQISDAARANMGEEVVTDLASFMDKAGYTQTSGSFRITEGGIEMASVPRQSVNAQANVYIGSMGDEIVEGNLRREGTQYGYAGGTASRVAPSGIEGTAGINQGPGVKGNVVMTQNLPEGLGPNSGNARVGKLVGTISHELTHIADMEAGLNPGELRSINSNINKTALSIHESINVARQEFEKGNYGSIDEAMRASGVLEAHQEFGRALGTFESLADTGKVSAVRRVVEQDPELGGRIGFSSVSDIADSVVGDGDLASAYAKGGFRDATGHAGTQRLLEEAGVSQELIDEINHSTRVISSATYAARTGGVESQTLEEGLELQGRRSYLDAENLSEEKKIQYGRLYDEEYQAQRAKGRFNIDVVDDVVDDVSEIVSQAGVKPETTGRPRLRLNMDEMPLAGRVSTAVDSSLGDAAESAARRVPPQPILEVGSGKASRKTLERIVESGMTAKRVIRSIF
jgi:hypothetical protein